MKWVKVTLMTRRLAAAGDGPAGAGASWSALPHRAEAPAVRAGQPALRTSRSTWQRTPFCKLRLALWPNDPSVTSRTRTGS